MNYNPPKLLLAACVLGQILLIGLSAHLMSKGQCVGIHAACIATNLIFGSVFARRLMP